MELLVPIVIIINLFISYTFLIIFNQLYLDFFATGLQVQLATGFRLGLAGEGPRHGGPWQTRLEIYVHVHKVLTLEAVRLLNNRSQIVLED